MTTTTLPVPEPANDTLMISIKQVCKRYGGVPIAWVDRQLDHKTNPFPKPAAYFGNRRFFLLEEVIEWERRGAVIAGQKVERRKKRRATTEEEEAA